MKVMVVDNIIIDHSWLSSRVLDNEKKILRKYPPTCFTKGKVSDGGTGLGINSLTSRFYHFNVLSWFGTKKLKKFIKNGYNRYNNVSNQPIFVQCWANVMRKGDKIKSHVHVPYPIDPIHSLSGNLCVKVDGSTNTYYDGTPILNKTNQMVFFPSSTSHWTDRYMSDSERITIAFDIRSKYWFDFDLHEDAKKHWIKL
jgi:hypothetical protein